MCSADVPLLPALAYRAPQASSTACSNNSPCVNESEFKHSLPHLYLAGSYLDVRRESFTDPPYFRTGNKRGISKKN